MSETFTIPEDYACKACGSKAGKWLHKPNADGGGIICQKCGTTEALFRSWLEELRSLTSKVKTE